MHMLTSLSVDEILPPTYMNWSANFRGLQLKAEMSLCLKLKLIFICVHVKASCRLR